MRGGCGYHVERALLAGTGWGGLSIAHLRHTDQRYGMFLPLRFRVKKDANI